jgi:hypothetical protein
MNVAGIADIDLTTLNAMIRSAVCRATINSVLVV